MAIIQNSALGLARKSAGNITYRVVNGQVIASKRITENRSKTPKQVARRNGFARVMKLAGRLKPLIETGFDPVKHGSRSNNFVKCNTDLMNFISSNEVSAHESNGLSMLYEVLMNEEFYGQVLAAKGTMNMRSEFFIDTEGQVNGLLSLSRDFQPGDLLTFGIGGIVKRDRITLDIFRIQTLQLGTSDIKALDQPRQFVVNKETMPDLNVRSLFSYYGICEGIILTAIVSNDSERTTSAFSAKTVG